MQKLSNRHYSLGMSKKRNQLQEQKSSAKLGITLPELQNYVLNCKSENETIIPQSKNKQFRISQQRKIVAQKNRFKLDQENSFSYNYCIDDTLRARPKAYLAQYMLSGYNIQDYNQEINKLHKQLIRKVFLSG
ncbi:hypothetical protein pb186bvf_012840 [Paramecium bursaria]